MSGLCVTFSQHKNHQYPNSDGQQNIGYIKRRPRIERPEMQVHFDKIDNFTIIEHPIIQIPHRPGRQHSQPYMATKLIGSADGKKPQQHNNRNY